MQQRGEASKKFTAQFTTNFSAPGMPNTMVERNRSEKTAPQVVVFTGCRERSGTRHRKVGRVVPCSQQHRQAHGHGGGWRCWMGKPQLITQQDGQPRRASLKREQTVDRE